MFSNFLFFTRHDEIIAIEPQAQAMSDEELCAQTQFFKDRLAKGETLDDILPEAFAVVREAAYRVLGLKAFKVQLMGAISLHNGDIAIISSACFSNLRRIELSCEKILLIRPVIPFFSF